MATEEMEAPMVLDEDCVEDKKRRYPWKFVQEEDFEYPTDVLKDRSFESTWLKITPNGTITVKGSQGRGYAWDGCTPKFNFLQITWGWFDGRLTRHDRTGKYKPYTYYGSMVHDALYQYKRCAPLKRKEADRIFYHLLKEAGYMWAGLYYFLVRSLGWVFRGWSYKKSNS